MNGLIFLIVAMFIAYRLGQEYQLLVNENEAAKRETHKCLIQTNQ